MKKDYAYLIGNQFAKGQPPNSGAFKKGHIGYRPPKGVHLSPATEFKKGNRPTSWLPVGSTKIRIDKSKTPRRWIKIAEPNQWKPYAVYLWEYVYGDIPEGFMIHHRNSLSLDDRIENLELTTRPEHINQHRQQLIEGKSFHLNIGLKLWPELTAKRNLTGYKMTARIKRIRARLAVAEQKAGQQALFE